VMPPIMVDGSPTPPITIPPEGAWVMPPAMSGNVPGGGPALTPEPKPG
jgi:hypothetical protein